MDVVAPFGACDAEVERSYTCLERYDSDCGREDNYGQFSDSAASPESYGGDEKPDEEEDEEDEEHFEDASEYAHSSASAAERARVADELLNRSSSAVRCIFLNHQLEALRLEKLQWTAREQELLHRLQRSREDIREQWRKVLNARSKTYLYEQELSLVTTRSKIRLEALERSYRTLCENVRLTDEASLRARIDVRRLQSRNLLLEELLQSKTVAYEQLESRMAELLTACRVTSHICNHSDTPYLTVRDGIGAMELNGHLSQEAHRSDAVPRSEGASDGTMCLSNAGDDTSQVDTLSDNTGNADGAVAVSTEGAVISTDGSPGSFKCSGELCAPAVNGLKDFELGPQTMNQLSHMVQSHLRQMISCSKDAERMLRDAVDVQIEELKEMLVQTRASLAYKTEECNNLSRTIENMRGELEITKNNLLQNLEEQSQTKLRYNDKLVEVETMQGEVDVLTTQYEEAKRELQSATLRERQSRATLDEYMKTADVKLYKMELLLSASGTNNPNAGDSAGEEAAVTVVPKADESSLLSIINPSRETLTTTDPKRDAPAAEPVVQPVAVEVAELTAKLDAAGEAKKELERKLTAAESEYKQKINVLEARLSEVSRKAATAEAAAAAAAARPPVPVPVTAPSATFPGDNSGQIKKLQEAFKESIIKLLRKQEDLKAQLAAKNGRVCLCRKSLEHVKASKLKRCWCRYKRIVPLKRSIAHAALAREATAIAAVVANGPLEKRHRPEVL